MKDEIREISRKLEGTAGRLEKEIERMESFVEVYDEDDSRKRDVMRSLFDDLESSYRQVLDEVQNTISYNEFYLQKQGIEEFRESSEEVIESSYTAEQLRKAEEIIEKADEANNVVSTKYSYGEDDAEIISLAPHREL